MKMRFSSSKYAAIGLVSALALAACDSGKPGFESNSRQSISNKTDELALRGSNVRNGAIDDAGRVFAGNNPVGRRNQYSEDHGVPFPPQFERSDSLEIVTPEPVSVRQVELLMQELTGLNVVMRTRYASGEGDLDIPINNMVRINHKGSLSELARTVASRFDMAWHFDGETLTFDRMVTRSYDVPLPSSTGGLTTTLGGVNVAGNSVSSNKSITLDPWAELTAALGSVVTEPGRVTTSPNTGQVTIFGSPTAQAEAAKVVETFENLYSRRIGLEIATFYVDTQKTEELTTDIGLSMDRGNVGASLGGGLVDALQGGIGVITAPNATTTFNLRNIAGNNAIADYQMSNTVTQNGVIAPIVLTNSKQYVSRITAGADGAGPSVETDNINSGISIYALPRYMRNGKIHLSVWLTQSELNSLETFDTGSGFVQLPDADQRAVEYTLIMEPGETLVMGGYEQERASSQDSKGVGGLGALGLRNSRDGGTTRTRMVLMVRPTLLPQ